MYNGAIMSVIHVSSPVEEAETFNKNITKAITEMQMDELKIEIHYGQSDNIFSALVIGRSRYE